MKRYYEYKKSEVFWLKEVPKHWKHIRYKYLFSEINERSETGQEELLSVSQYTGVTQRKSKLIDERENLTNASTLEGYKIVKVNDLVINIMLAWNGSLGISPYNGIVSPAYCVFRNKPQVNPKYFHYLLRTGYSKGDFKKVSTGVIESRLRMYPDDFYSLYTILPPISEQIQIAIFLNYKCQQIDIAVKKKKRLIKFLEEQNKAIINKAVTKGINENVLLKKSGVEWLGDIPKHWRIRKVKYLFNLITDTAPENNNEELLSIYTEIGVKPRKELEEKGNKASTTDGYWIVQKGDIIVNKLLAWMGAFGVSNYNGVTSPAYDILRSQGEANPYFYHYVFRNPKSYNEFKKYSRGIMDVRLRLYFSELGNIYMPFPEEEEQKEIVEFIEKERIRLNGIISKIEKEIDFLKEYKTTLIAEAVTGKIDLREWQPKNDENNEKLLTHAQTNGHI